jgi:hypothetical protein
MNGGQQLAAFFCFMKSYENARSIDSINSE